MWLDCTGKCDHLPAVILDQPLVAITCLDLPIHTDTIDFVCRLCVVYSYHLHLSECCYFIALKLKLV